MRVVRSAEMLNFAANGLNVVVLVAAARSYARTRSRVSGLTALIFVPALLPVTTILGSVTGLLDPDAGGALTAAIYLLRPPAELALAASFRPVRRWLAGLVGAVALILAGLMLAIPAPWPDPLLLAYALFYLGMGAYTARLFVAEARRRSGSSRFRLRTASMATWGMVALVTLTAVSGTLGWTVADAHYTYTVLSPPGHAVVAIALTLEVLTAVGYLVAFVPPRSLRALWSGRAMREIGLRTLDSSPTDAPQQVWQRYTDIVRKVTGAESVAVIRRDQHRINCTASGVPLLPKDIDRIIHARAAVLPLPRRDGMGLTAVAVVLRGPADAVLAVASRGHSLFHQDDVELLAEFGEVAAVLAERGAVVAELRTSLATVNDANERRNRFMAGVTHELRTPLNAIIGFGDIIRNSTPDTDPTHTWAEHILTGGYRLLALTNDLLDLAKAEAGHLDLHPEPVDLDELVTGLLAALDPLISRKQLQVHRHVPPIRVHADPIRLRQMLENLLSNAIKFTDSGGSITVTAESTSSHTAISVADSGKGIPAEDQEYVFEEFRQVGPPDQKAAGTGVGLALVRQVARAHGGDITLQSAPGVGSTFTITLPAQAHTATSPVRPALANEPTAPLSGAVG